MKKLFALALIFALTLTLFACAKPQTYKPSVTIPEPGQTESRPTSTPETTAPTPDAPTEPETVEPDAPETEPESAPAVTPTATPSTPTQTSTQEPTPEPMPEPTPSVPSEPEPTPEPAEPEPEFVLTQDNLRDVAVPALEVFGLVELGYYLPDPVLKEDGEVRYFSSSELGVPHDESFEDWYEKSANLKTYAELLQYYKARLAPEFYEPYLSDLCYVETEDGLYVKSPGGFCCASMYPETLQIIRKDAHSWVCSIGAKLFSDGPWPVDLPVCIFRLRVVDGVGKLVYFSVSGGRIFTADYDFDETIEPIPFVG